MKKTLAIGSYLVHHKNMNSAANKEDRAQAIAGARTCEDLSIAADRMISYARSLEESEVITRLRRIEIAQVYGDVVLAYIAMGRRFGEYKRSADNAKAYMVIARKHGDLVRKSTIA